MKKKIQKEKKKQAKKTRLRITLGFLALTAVFLTAVTVKLTRSSWDAGDGSAGGEGAQALKPEMDVELLTVNPYSRPGTETDTITGIVVHYTANPGATAIDNRNYFESLKDTHETKASSHFVVGLEGEILQCVPTWEVAYASNSRNKDTVSIECCHPDDTGKFNDATYQSMVRLCAWLCLEFGLDEEDIIRHYDVTGKNCPKYFVEHEDAWDLFREDVGTSISKAADAVSMDRGKVAVDGGTRRKSHV